MKKESQRDMKKYILLLTIFLAIGLNNASKALDAVFRKDTQIRMVEAVGKSANKERKKQRNKKIKDLKSELKVAKAEQGADDLDKKSKTTKK